MSKKRSQDANLSSLRRKVKVQELAIIELVSEKTMLRSGYKRAMAEIAELERTMTEMAEARSRWKRFLLWIKSHGRKRKTKPDDTPRPS